MFPFFYHIKIFQFAGQNIICLASEMRDAADICNGSMIKDGRDDIEQSIVAYSIHGSYDESEPFFSNPSNRLCISLQSVEAICFHIVTDA